MVGRLIFIFVASSLIVNCASIYEGNFVTPDRANESKNHSFPSGIVISGTENTTLSSQHFGEIDFTLENGKTEKARLDFRNFGSAWQHQ